MMTAAKQKAAAPGRPATAATAAVAAVVVAVLHGVATKVNHAAVERKMMPAEQIAGMSSNVPTREGVLHEGVPNLFDGKAYERSGDCAHAPCVSSHE